MKNLGHSISSTETTAGHEPILSKKKPLFKKKGEKEKERARVRKMLPAVEGHGG